jgi:hypothetical protein
MTGVRLALTTIGETQQELEPKPSLQTDIAMPSGICQGASTEPTKHPRSAYSVRALAAGPYRGSGPGLSLMLLSIALTSVSARSNSFLPAAMPSYSTLPFLSVDIDALTVTP